MALKSNLLKRLLVLALFWPYPALLPAVTPPLPAQPSQYVVDLAGVLKAETRARLNARLKDLEAATTAQVVVLTLNSLEGEPIEDFSHQTAVKWGIGQKGKDNGVLLTVAVKDKKYRLEVGYGLESTLPDSLVGSIGRQYLVPNFRQGDFAAGIVAAVNEVAKAISGGQGVGNTSETGNVAAKKAPLRPGAVGTRLLSPLTAILVIIFIIVLLIVLFSSRRGGGGGFWFFGGGGGGWSSGGGGDSGGFSGGGGDFGGGGASGDW